ncbi:serine/threonine-protein kinase [Cryobacterium sp. HLT2-28]|nr:serine/threonine-protein kinase [Cryobacterium sp. HLT2-28]
MSTVSRQPRTPTQRRHGEEVPGMAYGLISGRFRLGELLGTGGSASVFAAVDTENEFGRPVALKILHPHLSRAALSREAFFAEATAAAVLRHPNIVAVHGVGVHDPDREPLAWIALDLAPGVSLAEHVEKWGALPVPDALTVAAGVLAALEAAHLAGLIHRDISPANIMIDPQHDGTLTTAGVLLLDFGLADAAGRPALGADVVRTPASVRAVRGGPLAVLGSAHYLAPEQARGENVDERGDVYQLGGVLHFALTARPPFLRESTAAVLRAHLDAPPPVMSVLRSGIPRGVDRIVVRAMLKDPAARFQSAAEMGAAVAEQRSESDGRGGRQRLGDPTRTTAFSTNNTTAFATTDSVSGNDLTRTTVLVPPAAAPGPPQPPTTLRPTTMPAGARRTAARAPGAQGRAGRSRAGSLVAGLIVAGIIALAWANASDDTARSSVAVTSTPSATATPVATTTAPATLAPRASVRVPELTSMSLAEARAALAGSGLEVGRLATQESVRAGDTVLGVTPVPGSRVSPGASVDLVVASGSNAVPEVSGMTSGEAIAAIQSAGFVTLTESRSDAARVPGTVLGSAPGAGTVLRLRTAVTVTVAAAPTPNPAPSTSSPAPTSDPTSTPSTPPASPAP